MMRPTLASVKTIDEPPALTNGNGMPVIGMRCVTAAMFINAWMMIIPVSPPARSRPNGSRQPTAIRMPAYATTPNAATTRRVPTRPASSPMIARMKSL